MVGKMNRIKWWIVAGLGRLGFGSSIARNSVYMLAGESFARAISLLLTIFVTRHLGPERVGTMQLALKYAVLFGVFAEFGLTRAAVLIGTRGDDDVAGTKGLAGPDAEPGGDGGAMLPDLEGVDRVGDSTALSGVWVS